VTLKTIEVNIVQEIVEISGEVREEIEEDSVAEVEVMVFHGVEAVVAEMNILSGVMLENNLMRNPKSRKKNLTLDSQEN
jgi:hypothetical protein